MPFKYNIKTELLTDYSIPENAYLLGRLWADGSVDRNTITLFAKEGDMEHLFPFFEKMGIGSIYPRQRMMNGKPFGMRSWSVEINRTVLCSKLIALDYRQKSKVSPSKILHELPIEMHRLFWRGFLDGDGSIYVGKGSPKLAFWSTIEQDWKDLIMVMDNLGIEWHITKYERKGGKHKSSVLQVRRIAMMKTFCDWVYKSYEKDRIGLKRKFESYCRLVERAAKTQARSATGVTKRKNGLWSACIRMRPSNGLKSDVHLGTYPSEEWASQAYNSALKQLGIDRSRIYKSSI